MKIPTSRQFILVSIICFWNLNIISATNNHANEILNMVDSTILVEFYESTNGVNWDTTWNLNDPMTEWHGITFINNQVTRIQLYGNNLEGPIPLSMGNLFFLEILDLDSNKINDVIPSSLINLESLEVLNLSKNEITGTIPEFLGDMENLKQLGLSFNLLEGEIPATIGSLQNLNYLGLSYNQLTGPIPPSLGELSQMKYFFLNDNQLTGSIPQSLGNFNLPIDLRLSNNQLTGGIPTSLANLILLSDGGGIGLKNNKLSGCFPDELIVFCGSTPTIKCDSNINLPNEGDFETFCSNNEGECVEDDVWPGDFNNDGIANHEDLLFLGLAFGKTGEIRINASTDWTGQAGTDWENKIYDVNSKHQDANGDGEINDLDYDVLLDKVESYPLTHDSTSFISEVNNFTCQLEHTESNNNIHTIGVYLSNGTLDVHGVSFTFDLSSLSPQSISVNFENSFLNSDKHLYFHDTLNNQLLFSITRTDQQNLNITHNTLLAEIIIEDDIAALQDYIDKPYKEAINLFKGMSVFHKTTNISIEKISSNKNTLNPGSFIVYPNPNYGQVNIQSTVSNVRILEINLFGVDGQLVYSETKKGFLEDEVVNVNKLPNGLYFLHLKTATTIEKHKIILVDN